MQNLSFNMPKKDYGSDEYVISETGNWNVAADFSREKIMKPMIKCDFYEDIAKFGEENIIEELMGYGLPHDMIRFSGFRRLVEELIKLCNNAKFAMKKPGTKDELHGYKDILEKIRKSFPLLYETKKDNYKKTQQIKLIEDKFEKALLLTIEIKSDLNEPLNKNHLIFTDKEEFDPQAFKEKLKNRITDKG